VSPARLDPVPASPARGGSGLLDRPGAQPTDEEGLSSRRLFLPLAPGAPLSARYFRRGSSIPPPRRARGPVRNTFLPFVGTGAGKAAPRRAPGPGRAAQGSRIRDPAQRRRPRAPRTRRQGFAFVPKAHPPRSGTSEKREGPHPRAPTSAGTAVPSPAASALLFSVSGEVVGFRSCEKDGTFMPDVSQIALGN
jgi:hypothetical protein